MEKLKIGLIGCGTIGVEIAKACQDRLSKAVILTAICDEDELRALSLNRMLRKKARLSDLSRVVKDTEFVVEAASASISAEILEECINRKKSCMIMSVGGLIGHESLLVRASERGVKVFLPSGALCGIDGLKSASAGKVRSVTLTTKKPPRALAGAPYLKKKGIDISAIDKETVIFEGTALEAVTAFPQNINVSAVLSLAGIGARKTRVRIVASPEFTKNIHEVEIKGKFGVIFTRSENMPSTANPRTSALAIYSAIATLEGAVNSVRIGT